MAADYFVVGPTLVLHGRLNQLPATLQVRDARGPCGSILITPATGVARISCKLQSGDMVEGLRLAARVASRFDRIFHSLVLVIPEPFSPSDQRLLALDGFEADGLRSWRRSTAPFARHMAQARTMDELYADPFSVPWNFHPREHDVLVRARGALSGAATYRTVLDLGCGFGKNATYLEEVGYRVFGTDVSENAIRRCRELVAQPQHFVTASAAALPWESGFFDLVVDVGCLHCISGSDRGTAVVEAHRVLRPGGILISRMFQTRSADWVASQPFVAREMGLDPLGVRSLFVAVFASVRIDNEGDFFYVRASG